MREPGLSLLWPLLRMCVRVLHCLAADTHREDTPTPAETTKTGGLEICTPAGDAHPSVRDRRAGPHMCAIPVALGGDLL